MSELNNIDEFQKKHFGVICPHCLEKIEANDLLVCIQVLRVSKDKNQYTQQKKDYNALIHKGCFKELLEHNCLEELLDISKGVMNK